MASLHERAGRFDLNPAKRTAPFTCNFIALGHLQNAWDKVSMTSESLTVGNHETSLDNSSGQIWKLALLANLQGCSLTVTKPRPTA